MEQIINYVIGNWWVIAILVAVFLIPVFVGLLTFCYASIEGFDVKYRSTSYKAFWQDIVREKKDSWDPWWLRVLFCKYGRLCLLISLFFIWGYATLLIGWVFGWLCGIIWRFICAVGSGIGKSLKKVYEAI